MLLSIREHQFLTFKTPWFGLSWAPCSMIACSSKHTLVSDWKAGEFSSVLFPRELWRLETTFAQNRFAGGKSWHFLLAASPWPLC